jgi:acetolactate decarboxylase
MKNLHKYLVGGLVAVCIFQSNVQAQQQVAVNSNGLFSAGYAAAFIGGLYDAFYPYRQLKRHGDFGLGAPARLDGELTMLNGKLYQSRATGETLPISDTAETPYAVVCFFRPTMVFKPNKPMDRAALFHYLDSVLVNQNGIYAIHIKGTFGYIKTRAFPPVAQKPYQPLAQMLDRQHFFEFRDTKGDLVGYRTPAFLEGPLISGYHFHFLTDTHDHGGHLIDILTNDITIEVEMLSAYTIAVPQTADFNNFNFKNDRTEEIKSVENGKKQ